LRVRALIVALSLIAAGAAALPVRADRVRPLRWDDFPQPIQRRLTAAGIDRASFTAYQSDRARRTAERVRESDLDAMVYYALQSTAFTQEPPIEPALSAKAFVEGLDAETRTRFLAGSVAPAEAVAAPVRRRLTAFAEAVKKGTAGSRLDYFHASLQRETPVPADPGLFVVQQYVRATRFLYEKEFVAQQQADRGQAVAALYHDRGLSTDTAVEAGYLVYMGLATLKALEPERRIKRVLIVGPGLDLAPRTGLLEFGPPESYQPYAVADALVSLKLSSLDDLVIVGGDVNPRVVEHLRSARDHDVSLTLVSGLGDGPVVTLKDDYRSYFDQLGTSIAEAFAPPSLPSRYAGHLRKSLRVRQAARRAVDGASLDIASDRLDGAPVDLVIATNIFPYLDDAALTMALSNIASMLGPAGVLLHNEPRPLVGVVTNDAGLPFEQARAATVAAVRGGAPLADSVFMHVKRGG
jgi:hypothetical protein